MNLNEITKKLRPEILFVILSFTYGILLLVVTPPFESPDEREHFYRIYQISRFEILAQKNDTAVGGYISLDIINMSNDLLGGNYHRGECHHLEKASINKICRYLTTKQDSEKLRFVDFRNTALYSPVGYLPQVLGAQISNVLGLPSLWQLYIGRLFNLLAFIVVLYFAIKLIPCFKYGLILIALMPMTIAQVTSLSADSVTFSLSFLLISILFNYSYSDTFRLKWTSVFFVSIVAFLLGLTKLAYLLIPFLFFLIPINKADSKRKYILYLGSFFFLTFFGFLVWSFLIRDLYLPMLSYINPNAQTLYIVKHPYNFILSNLNTFSTYRRILVHSFVGNLGWLDNPIPVWLKDSYLIVLLLFAFFEDGCRFKMSIFGRLLIIGILISTILLLATTMYLSWNKVGAPIIDGLQGRYYIPLAPLFLFIYYNNTSLNKIVNRKTIYINLKLYILSLFLVLSLSVTVLLVFKRYF